MIEKSKNHQNKIQKFINRQACSITRTYQSILIDALINKLGLTPAQIILDFWQ